MDPSFLIYWILSNECVLAWQLKFDGGILVGMVFIQLFSFFYKQIRHRALHYFRRQLERKNQLTHIE